MIIDEEAYLEHFGVKGMKWGVRRQRREERLRRVAAGADGFSGKATTIAGYATQGLSVKPRLGPVDLIKGRGIQGAAHRKSLREAARSRRFNTGQAKVSDYLVRYGLFRASDFIPVREKNIGKKTIVDNRKVALAATGLIVVNGMLARKAYQQARG